MIKLQQKDSLKKMKTSVAFSNSQNGLPSIQVVRKSFYTKTFKEIPPSLEEEEEIPSKNASDIYSKGFIKPRSDIQSDNYSFFMLYQIYKKDRHFSLPLPDMLILNSGFDSPVRIKGGNGMSFQIMEDSGPIVVKQEAYNMLNSGENLANIPCGILKFSNGRKRLIMKAEEIFDLIPDLSQDMAIQKFVKPKGLRVSKFRVILNNSQPKVYIISNNLRLDAKNDMEAPVEVLEDDTDIKTSVINHARIVKYIKNFYKSEIPDIEKMPAEKKQCYELFKVDPTVPKKNVVVQKKLGAPDSELFMTHSDLKKSQFYLGKNSGYSEIIGYTENIQQKINAYLLKNEIITQLAVDYFQDNKKSWIFSKIAYGKTKKYDKPVIPHVKYLRNYKSAASKSEFNDNYNYKDEYSSIIRNLLHPSNVSEESIHKSFAFHKKLYGFD